MTQSILFFWDILFIYFLFLKILFIHDRQRQRGRDPGRGRSRLHAGSPKWDSILGLQDQGLAEGGTKPLRHPGCPKEEPLIKKKSTKKRVVDAPGTSPCPLKSHLLRTHHGILKFFPQWPPSCGGHVEQAGSTRELTSPGAALSPWSKGISRK